MSLIEHPEREGWQELLRNFFETALNVLKNNPYQHCGSAVDDAGAWIRQGGVSLFKERLSNQMKMRQFPEDRNFSVWRFFCRKEYLC